MCVCFRVAKDITYTAHVLCGDRIRMYYIFVCLWVFSLVYCVQCVLCVSIYAHTHAPHDAGSSGVRACRVRVFHTLSQRRRARHHDRDRGGACARCAHIASFVHDELARVHRCLVKCGGVVRARRDNKPSGAWRPGHRTDTLVRVRTHMFIKSPGKRACALDICGVGKSMHAVCSLSRDGVCASCILPALEVILQNTWPAILENYCTTLYICIVFNST